MREFKLVLLMLVSVFCSVTFAAKVNQVVSNTSLHSYKSSWLPSTKSSLRQPSGLANKAPQVRAGVLPTPPRVNK